MQKLQIRKVGVLSVAKIYAIVMFVTSLLISIPYGAIFALFGTTMMASLAGMDPSVSGSDVALGGAGSIAIGLGIMCGLPILYAIVGFIGGAIGALIYNVAARFVGGVELELVNAE